MISCKDIFLEISLAFSMASLSLSMPQTRRAPKIAAPFAKIPVPHPKSATFLSFISPKRNAFHNTSEAIIEGVD